MKANKKRAVLAAREQAANQHRTARRLKAVARLQALLAHAVGMETTEERELRRLHEYLLMWKRWTENWEPRLGFPKTVPYVDLMRPSISMDLPREGEEKPDPWAMNIMDTSIDELGKLEDGMAMRAALRVRMLNEAYGIHVFRHGRLQKLKPEDVDELADRAEAALVPIIKAKGIPL